MNKPRLALTMGDPLGIGPEIVAASWLEPRLNQECSRVVVGSAAILQRAVELLRLPIRVERVSSAAQASDDPTRMPVVEVAGPALDPSTPPGINVQAGRLAHDCIVMATQMALAGDVGGIVTPPISKAALEAAGCEHIGHTELLAALTGVAQAGMLLYLPAGSRVPENEVGLGVVHVTLHVSLRRALDDLNESRIVHRCQLIAEFFQSVLDALHIDRPPRIAVAALNPHGGEGGLFGREELDIIAPAVATAQRLKMPVVGPLPCDTLMGRAARGEFDGVVAMFHDQGHIALKLLGMHDAVNITLGLPIVRVSVAHGTAYDLAWQGRANCGSMIEATRMAALLARRRRSPVGLETISHTSGKRT